MAGQTHANRVLETLRWTCSALSGSPHNQDNAELRIILIPARFFGALRFTNLFFGDTLLGIHNHRMVKEKNLVTVGCTIDGLKPRSSFIVR